MLLSFRDVQRSPRARGTPTETQWPRATYTVRAALMASWHGKGLHKEGEREDGCLNSRLTCVEGIELFRNQKQINLVSVGL